MNIFEAFCFQKLQICLYALLFKQIEIKSFKRRSNSFRKLLSSKETVDRYKSVQQSNFLQRLFPTGRSIH